MNNYDTQEDFDSKLTLLRQHFSSISESDGFVWDDVSAILMLKIKKNWTVESSNSNYQINSNHVNNFFPILQISESFPHWRMSMDGKVPKAVLTELGEQISKENQWLEGKITYRHKIQNSYPYIQLTLEDSLRTLKNVLREDNQIYFFKKNKEDKYYILATRIELFNDDKFLAINPNLSRSDNTMFHLSEISSPDIDSSKLSPSNIIYYGAPGTGKSHKVKQKVQGKEERTERVTFHPEYDYSSFIGGYKPTMDGDNIRYEFVPQAFTNIYVKAWNDLDNDYYLVIEEINRGNCAEIFGDIFQLLDRTNDYKITPSKELKEYLEIQLLGNTNIDAAKLLLPPNLNILATMNTSDQSLFPMDSAFKRRWDWEYIPINYSRDEDKNSSAKFVVNISDDESFKWLDFIEKINEKISNNDNLGMDKCLGNYFIKPKKDEIKIETFVNKAIFYLWNDVFKDEREEDSIFKDKTTYEKFFPIDDENGKQKVRDILEYLNIDYNSSK
jgi:hypothetical protein